MVRVWGEVIAIMNAKKPKGVRVDAFGLSYKFRWVRVFGGAGPCVGIVALMWNRLRRAK